MHVYDYSYVRRFVYLQMDLQKNLVHKLSINIQEIVYVFIVKCSNSIDLLYYIVLCNISVCDFQQIIRSSEITKHIAWHYLQAKQLHVHLIPLY